MIGIVTSVLGTLGFSVLLKVPKRLLFFTTGGGCIAATVFALLENGGAGTFGATLAAMIAISVYAEILARLLHTPATVLLLPSSVPLLPGSAIYYAMQYVVVFNREQFLFYAGETVKTGIGMGLGAIIVASLTQTALHLLRKEK